LNSGPSVHANLSDVLATEAALGGKGPTLDSAAAWLAGLPIAEAMRSGAWAYPLAEIAHITGLAVLVGSIFVVDLRLLGAGRTLPVGALMRLVLPWTLGSLLLVVPSGVLLFAAHATELIRNPAFVVKLVLLALAGINALAFHLMTRRGVTETRARWAAGLSMLLWLAVISAGRMIAYV
jgi:hypothetical protein